MTWRAPEAHQARPVAESFGADPARYDRARPRYPAAMVRASGAASPGPDLLDVGLGTGIAARPFQAAGCQVLGGDVDARMAAFARQRGLDVEVARFEGWEPAGRTVDVVIAGQTWHWIEPVAGAAKAAAVLRPGGRLAVFWNVVQPPPEVAEAFAGVYRAVLPRYNPWARPALDLYAAIFAKTAVGIRTVGGFGAAEQWRCDWERSYTRDEWLEAALTGGDARQIPPATRKELLAGVGAAIDALGGRITMGSATVVVTATRTDLA